MTGEPAYIVLGDGRWATVIREALSRDGRRSSSFKETRRLTGESEEAFKMRVSRKLTSLQNAQIAWLCIPPCDEVPLLIESAVRAGLHVIVEKPWLCTRKKTEALMDLAIIHRVHLAIHFQYCFLEQVEKLRTYLPTSSKHKFSGTFTISRGNRLGIPPLDNLGSHLFAIREYAAPNSEIGDLHCEYNSGDDRRVLIEAESGSNHLINLSTDEPIIQRFSRGFEEAISSLNFSHSLDFALRVAEAISAFKAKKKNSDQPSI